MGGDEDVELAGVVADAFGKTRAGQHLVQGVPDVFQVAVEVVAVALEPILQAFEQVAWEVRVVAGGIAVGADGVEAFGNEVAVTVPGLIDVGVLADLTS